MAETGSVKSQRSKTFSLREVETINDYMKEHIVSINAKHSSGVGGITKKTQDMLWSNLTAQVNAIGTSLRTVSQVKEKWRNMVKKAKTEFTAENISCKKTGGGPALPMCQASLSIVSLLKENASFSGIKGGVETTIARPQGDMDSSSTGTKDCNDVADVVGVFDEEMLTKDMPFPAHEAAASFIMSCRGDADELTSQKETETSEQDQGENIQKPSENMVTYTSSENILKKDSMKMKNVRKPLSLKDRQLVYLEKSIQVQDAQLECFRKMSRVADVLINKFS